MEDGTLCYDGVPVPSNGTLPMYSANIHRERRLYNTCGLLLESTRLATFSFWNPNVIGANELAKSGFYYTRTLDQVQCVFCKGTIGQFNHGDEADKEHWRHFNHKCPFIKEEPTGNVPLSYSSEHQNVYRFLQNYYMDLSNVVSTNTSNLPMVPHMNTENARRNTFHNWPQNTGMDVNTLVKAGFFSVEAGDIVQCYHCGGCMFNWHQGDDPINDHSKMYPHCKFIQIKANIVPRDHPRTVQQRSLTEDEANLLLQHPIAMRLMELGVSKQNVKDSLKIHLEKHGVLPATVKNGMEFMMRL